MTYLTFEVAIILIFKHAANLCLSGISAKLAITQVESDYREANIASKIEEHFTASFQEYSIEQFVSFLMNTSIGLLSLVPTLIIADTVLRGFQMRDIVNLYTKKKDILW